ALSDNLLSFSPDGTKLSYEGTAALPGTPTSQIGPEQLYIAPLSLGTVVASTALTFTFQTSATESAIGAPVTAGTDGKSYINAEHFNGGAITLTGTADAGDHVVVTDATGATIGALTADAITGAWSLGVTGLVDGHSYAYTATATNATGSTATGNIAFTVDATAPTVAITGFPITTLTSPTITLSGTGEPGTKVFLFDNPALLMLNATTLLGSAVTVDSTGHWSETVTLPASYPVHHIWAEDTDAAYNTGMSSEVDFLYQPPAPPPPPPPPTAPVITSDGGGTTATIAVSRNEHFSSQPANFVTKVVATDANAGHTVSYAIVGGADASEFAIDAKSGALTFLAKPDTGTYTVKVAAVDSASTGGMNLTDTQKLTVTVGTSRLNGDSANHDTFDLGHNVGTVKVGNVNFTRDTFTFDKTMFADTSALVAHAADVVVNGQHSTQITYTAPAGQPAEHDVITLTNVSLTSFKAAVLAHPDDFHFV
ncbi:MAG TPA: hypothetical protein VLU24_05810, partial [Mycobacterium sp.]|nr:hypothetical protein [Mycobacterium sp.]